MLLVEDLLVNEAPQLQAVVSVEVVGDGLQLVCRDVLSWKEVAVANVSVFPFYELHYSVKSQ